MNDLRKLPRLIGRCMTIGEIPTSYKVSLTYEEQLIWFCNFLENEVIPVVNNNSQVVEDLKNYFENLDVQEEINNKLDEMAESGQLEEIISQYIQLQGLLCYNTVSDMKNATNLVNGSFAKTFGYNSLNDKGGSYYKIREITNIDDVDDKKIISILSTNNLVAELMDSDKIYVEQLGAIENQDISSILNYAFENFNVPIFLQKNYLLSDNITINNKTLNLNNNKITSVNKVITLTNGAEMSNGILEGTNIVLGVGKEKLYDITLKDWTGKAIELINGAYECKIENINFANDTTNGEYGIYCTASDNYIKDVYGYGAFKGIYASGSDNYYENIHLWLNHNNDFTGSIFAEIYSSDNFIVNSTIDSYETGIKMLQTYLNLVLDNCNWINNNTLFNNKTFKIIDSQANCEIKGRLYIKATAMVSNNNLIQLGDTSYLDIEIQDNNANVDKNPSVGKDYMDSHITPAGSLCFGTINNNSQNLSADLTIYAPGGNNPPTQFNIDLSKLLNVNKISQTYMGSALYKSGSSNALSMAQAKIENGHMIISKPNGISYSEGMWEFRLHI